MSPRHDELFEKIASRKFLARGSRFHLLIAGLRVDLWTQSRSVEAAVMEYFRGYRLDTGQASRLALRAELSVDELPGGDPELWNDEDPEYRFRGEAVVQRDFVARRTEAGPAAGAMRATSWVGPVTLDALHNLLRWFLPVILIENGAFLMHAGGLVYRDEGYVFFGQSGAGKSTSTGLASGSDPEVALVGDDSVIIQCREGECWMHSAPLGCGYSREAPPNRSVPLRGLFSLRQAGAPSVERLPRAQGAALLLASAMNAFAGESLEQRLELAAAFAGSVTGIRQLSFARDPAFWRLVSRGENINGGLQSL